LALYFLGRRIETLYFVSGVEDKWVEYHLYLTFIGSLKPNLMV